MAGVERGLSYEAIERMTIGQVVDFVIEYNNRNLPEEEKVRKATREDIQKYFGV